MAINPFYYYSSYLSFLLSFFSYLFSFSLANSKQLYCYYIFVLVIFSSQNIKLSLLLLLVGVGIASITDLQLNLLGSILSVLAIATTCVGQIVSFYLYIYFLKLLSFSLSFFFLFILFIKIGHDKPFSAFVFFFTLICFRFV